VFTTSPTFLSELIDGKANATTIQNSRNTHIHVNIVAFLLPKKVDLV
jgi:hypothetical protein